MNLAQQMADECESFAADWVDGIDPSDHDESIFIGVMDVCRSSSRDIKRAVLAELKDRGVIASHPEVAQ